MLSKGSLLRATLIVVAFIGVFVLIITLRSHDSSKSTPASPKAVATFPAKHHTWVVWRPQAPNEIYHFFEDTQIGIAPYASDPGVGKIITQEVWLESNSNGAIQARHDIERLPDGSLLQEELDTTSTTIIIRGPAYFPIEGNASNPFWCVSKGPPITTNGSITTFPYYVDTTGVTQDGFVASIQSISKPVPPAPSAITGTSPSQALTVPNSVHEWQATGVAQDGHDISKVRIDADDQGRIIAFVEDNFNSAGNQIGTQWYSFGQIEIYASSAQLPSTIFAVPQQVTKGCNS